MSWVDEVLGKQPGSREQLMNGLQTLINAYRAQDFYDVEIYHILYGLYTSSDNYALQALWPLYDYWLGILLDWDDEMEVEA